MKHLTSNYHIHAYAAFSRTLPASKIHCCVAETNFDNIDTLLIRLYFTNTNRVISVWNCLPNSVVVADSINSFKSRLATFCIYCMILCMITELRHLLPEVQ